MRHFLLPAPVTALAFGMGVTAAQAVLIAVSYTHLDVYKRQRAHRASQRFAAFDRLRQQLTACRHRLHQMTGAAMRGGLMLMRDQGRDVLGDFDLLPAVITAPMGGDHGLAIEDAYLIQAGDDAERARHAGMRDRIVIQVEAHVGRLASADGLRCV